MSDEIKLDDLVLWVIRTVGGQKNNDDLFCSHEDTCYWFFECELLDEIVYCSIVLDFGWGNLY